MTDTDVVIVGGGIIGAATAWSLSKRGLSVTVCDAGPPRVGTSFANAGHIVVSHSIPFAAPGMVTQGLDSWRKRTGAFSINPSVGTAGAHWLKAFRDNCTDANVQRFQPALRELLERTSEAIHQHFPEVVHTGKGLWQLFTGEGAALRRDHELEHLHRYGVDALPLAGETVRAAEPLITADVQAALELPHDFGVDPYALWSALHEGALRQATRWEPYARIDRVTSDSAGVVVSGPQGEIRARTAVIAAGVWSRELAQSLTIRCPMIAAKGYSVTVENVAQGLRRPLLLADQYLAVTPMGESLRMSSRFELTSSSDRSIPRSRITQLIDRARFALALPDFLGDVHPWTGLRPATADGAPIIGYAQPGIVLATGHGMLGTSMSLGTAHQVAALITGEETAPSLRVLNPARR